MFNACIQLANCRDIGLVVAFMDCNLLRQQAYIGFYWLSILDVVMYVLYLPERNP
jgi:hypothetical protein